MDAEESYNYQTGGSDEFDPETLELIRKHMAEDLGLKEDASLDQIDEAMKKKYHVD